jgi:hypothetical protein
MPAAVGKTARRHFSIFFLLFGQGAFIAALATPAMAQSINNLSCTDMHSRCMRGCNNLGNQTYACASICARSHRRCLDTGCHPHTNIKNNMRIMVCTHPRM